jgi:hypothetical protein
MAPVSAFVRALAVLALLAATSGAARADEAPAHGPALAAMPDAGSGAAEAPAGQGVTVAPARATGLAPAPRRYTLADAMRDAQWRQQTADRLDTLFGARRAAN